MTEKKKIIRIDESRMLTYSALAAALLSGKEGFATVVLSDIADTNISLESFGIDFNSAAADGDEFTIIHKKHDIATTYDSAKIDPIDNAARVVRGGLVGIAAPLSSGNYIGATLTKGGVQWSGDDGGVALDVESSFQFHGVNPAYIGVEFPIDGSTHYGWIRVFVHATTDNIQIQSFAYETTAGLGINAGSDTSLPVVLSVFRGYQEGKTVVVNWSTDSEIENIGFILERRAAGSADWKQIAHFDSDPELEGQGSKVTRTDYSFVDKNVEIGKRYSYRLTDVSYQVMYKGISRIIQDVEVNPLVASSFKLHPSYPNPFNPNTTVGFTLDKPEAVKLSVYNLKGQLLESLLDEERTGGYHEVDWNASDMAAGVYFVETVAGDHRQMQKITLVK